MLLSTDKIMCVTQFRKLCEASEFRSKGREEDLKDPNLKVRKETYFYNGRSYHYVTDKRKLKGLENYLKSR